jgi:hypothetical protein
MTDRVVAYLDLDQELYHTSYVYTGLALLARSGGIKLELRTPEPSDWRKAEPGDVCVHLEVCSPGMAPLLVSIDLWDRSDRFSAPALEHADMYYKRSFFQPDLERIRHSARARVRPFGINYSCRTASTILPLLRGGIRQKSLQRGRELIRAVYDYWRLRRPGEFTWSPEQPKSSLVLLQTRVWEPHEVIGDQAEIINDQRAGLVRALKSAFGPRFAGGLVPNALARRQYPDLLTASRSDPKSYTRLTRTALIGIYTRGLHHSTAWKLGEYFAASMGVVAEPIRNALPAPVVPGKHVLNYTTADECIAACERILGDRTLQQSLRESAYQYYVEHIEPAAHIARCINDAKEPPPTSPPHP